MRKTKTLVAIILMVALISCSGKQTTNSQDVVNTISDAMSTFNFVHKTVEDFLIVLKQNGTLTGEPLQKFQKISGDLAPIAIALNQDWMTIDKTATSIESFIADQDFQSALLMIGNLSQIAKNHGFVNSQTDKQIETLKRPKL